MSKFKTLFDRLEQILIQRIEELRPEIIAEQKHSAVLIRCAQNETGRKALLLELPSALYASINREFLHTTSAGMIRAISDLANVVFEDAHPKYQAKPLAKPKLANLFGQYKRFFVEQFNLNALLVVERLQSANYYTQAFSLNMLVRQLIQISTETYISKLRKLAEQAKKEEQLVIRPPILEEAAKELNLGLETPPDQKTVPTSKSNKTVVVTERKPSRSVALCVSAKKQFPKPDSKDIKRDPKPEPELGTQIELILTTSPKQLSIVPRRLNTAKPAQPTSRILRPLVLEHNRTPSLQPCSKPIQKQRTVSIYDRKLQCLDDLYSPLALDPRSIRELASLDERHFRAQIRSNSKYIPYFRPSPRTTPGGSVLPC